MFKHNPNTSCHILFFPQLVDFSSMHLCVHVFQLHEDGPGAEELEEDCDVSAANHWMLPSSESYLDQCAGDR